jgi:hypothetical protein
MNVSRQTRAETKIPLAIVSVVTFALRTHASQPIIATQTSVTQRRGTLVVQTLAKRRAIQHGKRISFGITTNGTLVTDDVVEFWRNWNMGFHTSIDGTPDVQDRNRPTASGKGSSSLVEQSAKRILAHQRNTTARSTVVAESAGALVASYKYFRDLKRAEGDQFIPYDIYPKSPGLLVWGSDVNGHMMFWLTEGQPEKWPLVLMTVDGQFEQLQMSTTTFLARVFSGAMECILWDKEWIKIILRVLSFIPNEADRLRYPK